MGAAVIAGGSAEVSSHQVLNFAGTADLRAPGGAIGSLLLDPENVTIAASGNTPSISGSGPYTLAANQDTSVLAVSTLQSALALADVTVSTGSSGSQAGDITVASTLSWGSNYSLTLSAYRNITINDSVIIANTGAGNLTFRADNTGTGIGTVTFNGVGKVDYAGSTGLVSIFYNPADNPAGSVVNATSYISPTDYSSDILTNTSVANQSTAYMLVNSAYDLQNIQNNLSGDYALGTNIDATATSSWNGGAGFRPIGNLTGTLNGLGNSISNLFIQDSTDQKVGLFGEVDGSVKNVVLNNVAVTGTASQLQIGGLVGVNNGSLSNVSVSGTVTGASTSDSLTFASSVGGVAGSNTGTIDQSNFSGKVVGNNLSYAGGLTGTNTVLFSQVGKITNSYSLGTISLGASGVEAGGIAGYNGGSTGLSLTATIGTSYFSGTITGALVAGGLVGLEKPNSDLHTSYWDTTVSGLPNSYGLLNVTSPTSAYLGTGLTSAQFKASLPTGLDSSIWAISATVNGGYPYLKWQTTNSGIIGTTVSFGTPAPSTVTWNVANTSSTYGTLATLGAASLSGVASVDSANVGATVGLFSGSTPITLSASLGAGTYSEQVTALTGSAAGNYTLATTGNTLGTLTINPKQLTWMVANASSVFGSTPVGGSATLSGIVGSDQVSGTVGVFNGSSQIALSSSTPVGPYTENVISLIGTAAPNYVLATGGNSAGLLTITVVTPPTPTPTPTSTTQTGLTQTQRTSDQVSGGSAGMSVSSGGTSPSAISANLLNQVAGKLAGFATTETLTIISKVIDTFVVSILANTSTNPADLANLQQFFLEDFTKQLSAGQAIGQIRNDLVISILSNVAADTIAHWLQGKGYSAESTTVIEATYWTQFLINTSGNAAIGFETGGPDKAVAAAIQSAAETSISAILAQSVATQQSLNNAEQSMITDERTILSDEATFAKELQQAAAQGDQAAMVRDEANLQRAQVQITEIDGRLRATIGGPLYWLLFGSN